MGERKDKGLFAGIASGIVLFLLFMGFCAFMLWLLDQILSIL